MKIDISRPDFIFFVVWSIPLILLQFFSLDFFIDLSTITISIILFNIFSFFIIYIVVKKSVKNKVTPNKVKPKFDFILNENFFKFYLILWIFFYFITIIFSKGAPLYWILSGSNLTYSDFGVTLFFTDFFITI